MKIEWNISGLNRKYFKPPFDARKGSSPYQLTRLAYVKKVNFAINFGVDRNRITIEARSYLNFNLANRLLGCLPEHDHH
jgi:hypothetical protein